MCKCKIFNQDGLPEHEKALRVNNKFIITGYRYDYCLEHAIKSLFSWHNETLNIWSHLLPIIFFPFLVFYTLNQWGDTATIGEKISFLIWSTAVILQLVSSVSFHLIGCMTANIYIMSLHMDYAGIFLLISASYFPPFYYTFYCKPTYLIFYIAGISTLSCTGLVVFMHPTLQKKITSFVKTLLFIAVAFFWYYSNTTINRRNRLQ